MIVTSRLRLRHWRESDVPEFMRATNTAPVMDWLGGLGTLERFETLAASMRESQQKNGFCFWIAERCSDGAILGFCGLLPGTVKGIANDVEIGWRLREDVWGQGYAREGAEASLEWAWRNLDRPQIVAITAKSNFRSWGLMRRLGMMHRADLDFDHPAFKPGHPLREHVTYSIARP